MTTPLPETLRVGVYEAYGHGGYGQFMQRVVALQEGTMSLEQADNDVFAILGYDGGKTDRYNPSPIRDSSSKSHRPDLYRLFVQWSTAAPPATPKEHGNKSAAFSFGVIKIPATSPKAICLDTLKSEMLAKDLISLDAMRTMSPAMHTAIRTVSIDAMRSLWQQELLKRVSADARP